MAASPPTTDRYAVTVPNPGGIGEGSSGDFARAFAFCLEAGMGVRCRDGLLLHKSPSPRGPRAPPWLSGPGRSAAGLAGMHFARVLLQRRRRAEPQTAEGAFQGPRTRGLLRSVHGRCVGLLAVVLERVLGPERASAIPADRLDLVVLHVRHNLGDSTPSHPPRGGGPGVGVGVP